MSGVTKLRTVFVTDQSENMLVSLENQLGNIEHKAASGRSYELELDFIHPNELEKYLQSDPIFGDPKLPDLIIMRPGLDGHGINVLSSYLGQKDYKTGKGAGLLLYTLRNESEIERLLIEKNIKGISVVSSSDHSNLGNKIEEALANIDKQGIQKRAVIIEGNDDEHKSTIERTKHILEKTQLGFEDGITCLNNYEVAMKHINDQLKIGKKPDLIIMNPGGSGENLGYVRELLGKGIAIVLSSHNRMGTRAKVDEAGIKGVAVVEKALWTVNEGDIKELKLGVEKAMKLAGSQKIEKPKEKKEMGGFKKWLKINRGSDFSMTP